MTKKELEDLKAELRNKDRDMEDLEERHQVEIKVYKQKVKHLLFEHQSNITTLKTDTESALKNQLDEFKVQEQELQKDKRFLRCLPALSFPLKDHTTRPMLSHRTVWRFAPRFVPRSSTELPHTSPLCTPGAAGGTVASRSTL